MPVYISIDPLEVQTENLPLGELKEFAENLLKALNLENAELSLVFTDDKTIQKLNREWRNKDKPTDVLSFPQDFPERELKEEDQPQRVLKEVVETCRGCNLLGDIVISVDTAKRQAQSLGWSFENELKRLILHGLVHLLGFDHEKSPTDGRKFREIESYLWRMVEKSEPFKW